MKIAIHHEDGSFSNEWISYCQRNNIEYKLVNAFDSDIIQQLSDYDAFMWHHSHYDYRSKLFAKSLIFSLHLMGKKTIPSYFSCWSFDDKIAEKYALEAIGAPLIKTQVFYEKKEALDWAEKAAYPKVFKMRCGAGSSNVRLVKNKKQARQLIKKAFSAKGFSNQDYVNMMKIALKAIIHGKKRFYQFFKYLLLTVFPNLSKERRHLIPNEKGYILFQDYVENEGFDIRVVVVGDKAFAVKRLCREGDFRASGSGNPRYEKEHFSDAIIKMSFDFAEKMKCDLINFDYIIDLNGTPHLCEMSYGTIKSLYYPCVGYWDKSLTWHEGKHFDWCGWMVELLKEQKPDRF